ncbi:GDP-Man:Man(1)GlcNAc(2)-PP-Dol alpha-1,3-mannosyltransferase [Citrus sinensis]|nr:GDP-Man:Man(1)GlcNAc(2)-PP-Dol alpha-1,3-mannosyltransferase [Citrus sinensis]
MEQRRSSKLNVAIIHPDLGIGGAERLIVDAAVELVSHGHNVHVFTAHHDKRRCFEETVNDQVSVVIPVLKLRSSTKVLFYCHFPDLLLAQHTTFLRRLYRKPIDFVEELTTGMADMILVNSKFTANTFANTFKKLHARGIRPAVLYPAVNVDQFDKPHSYKLNFLSINRFERKKNIDLALSAFAMLQNLEEDVFKNHNTADVTLTIAEVCADGLLAMKFLVVCGYDKRLRENVEYLEELKSLAERNGVSDRVNFITSCSTTERNALLSECLCVLYTPKDEHFGIVPLEAMAAYKPVIACDSGGPVETIKNEVTGFLCNPTPHEFSLAMAKLIQEPQMAKKMGENARQHVMESFSTKIFGQHLNRLLAYVARTQDKAQQTIILSNPSTPFIIIIVVIVIIMYGVLIKCGLELRVMDHLIIDWHPTARSMIR